MGARFSALVVTSLLCIPIVAPSVVADWGTDTWLSNVWGPERLENGDEFGCHGYEGVDTLDSNWVIPSCREYLEGQTDASRWGKSPVSFGIESKIVDDETGALLIDSGFMIVGDIVEEAPEGLDIAIRNGASIEKGLVDQSLIESAEEDSLISVHWRARIGDQKVRDDHVFVSWLEDHSAWLTTWGEWHHHRDSGIDTSVESEGTSLVLKSAPHEGGPNSWSVPGTTLLEFNETVISVSDSGGHPLPSIDIDERKLSIGWRSVDGGIILTQSKGSTVTIELDSEPVSLNTTPMLTFNDLDHSLTIVGHHTTSLFRWIQDFPSTELTFTWLVERPSSDAIGWKLPIFAVALIVAIPLSIVYLLRIDQSSRTKISD